MLSLALPSPCGERRERERKSTSFLLATDWGCAGLLARKLEQECSEGCRATSSLSGSNPVVRRRFCHLGEAGRERGKRLMTPCEVPDHRATEPDESLKPPQQCLHAISASLDVCVTAGAVFWWFSDGFHQFLAQFAITVWGQLVLLHQLPCGIGSDSSRWLCKTHNSCRWAHCWFQGLWIRHKELSEWWLWPWNKNVEKSNCSSELILMFLKLQ